MSATVTQNVVVPLGRVLVTSSVREAIEAAGDSLGRILTLHESGNWGSVPYEDRIANDDALANGGRFVSLHHTKLRDEILLITENGVTKVMRPYEFGW